MEIVLSAKNEIELWRILAHATTDYAESSGLELFQCEAVCAPDGRADGDRGSVDRCHRLGDPSFLLFDSFPGPPILRIVGAGGAGDASREGSEAGCSVPRISGLSPQPDGSEPIVSPASALCAVMLNLLTRKVSDSRILVCRSSCLLSPAANRIGTLSPTVARIPFLSGQLPSPDSPWHERARAYNRFWIVTAKEAGNGEPIGRSVLIDTRGRAIFIRETGGPEPDCQTIMYGEAVGRPVWMRDGIVDAVASRIFSFLSE